MKNMLAILKLQKVKNIALHPSQKILLLLLLLAIPENLKQNLKNQQDLPGGLRSGWDGKKIYLWMLSDSYIFDWISYR